MNPPGDKTGPFEAALRIMLPAPEQALLLAACLKDADAAARAWFDFAARVADVKGYFEANQTGLKGMLPFIETSLANRGIDAGRTFHTYARVALVREELRSRIYGEILESVLAALAAQSLPVILLKGGALSATVYPQPSNRHNHAIDLLVGEAEMSAACAVLARAEFTPCPPASGMAFHRDFRHTSGLALGLHSRALFLPQFEMPADRLHAGTREVRIGGRTVTVLSPEASLVHVCGHAVYSHSRGNLRWACDAHYLVQRNPAMDWEAVTDLAVRSNLALPLYVLLAWVRDALGTPVPSGRLGALRAHGAAPDPVAAEGIYAALLHSTLSRRRAFEAFDSSRLAQCGFIKFSAFPSLRYVRWRHNIDRSWKVPAYYADRPRRLAVRLALGAARRIVANRTAPAAGVAAKKGAA